MNEGPPITPPKKIVNNHNFKRRVYFGKGRYQRDNHRQLQTEVTDLKGIISELNNRLTSNYLDHLSPVLRLDSLGHITSYNQMAETDLGFDVNDLGKSLTEIRETKDNPDILTIMEQTIKAANDYEKGISTEKVSNPILTFVTKDTKTKYLMLVPKSKHVPQTQTLATEDAGKVIGFEIELFDITRLVESIQQEAKNSLQQEALRKAISFVSEGGNTHEILTRIRKILATIIPHDRANIILVNPDKSLQLSEAWGYENGKPKPEKLDTKSIDEKPILATILSEKKAVLISNTDKDTRWIKSKSEKPVKSYLGLPIRIGGEVVGILNLNSFKKNHFQVTDLSLVQAFADQVGIVLEKAQAYETQQRLTQEKDALSRTDSLTGLSNRRDFDEKALHEIAEAIRFGHDISLIAIDLDRFSLINDAFGHPKGDEILKIASNLFKKSTRLNVDIVGRIGGEEFLILLLQSSEKDALITAERIRRELENIEPLTYREAKSVNTKHGKLNSGDKVPITGSFGISSLEEIITQTQDLQTIFTLLKKIADERENHAKRLGRNRVVGS